MRFRISKACVLEHYSSRTVFCPICVETDHLSFRKLALDSNPYPEYTREGIETAPAKAEERKVGDGERHRAE